VNNEEIIRNYFLNTKIDYYEGSVESLSHTISYTYDHYICPTDLLGFLTSDSFLENYSIQFFIKGNKKYIIINHPFVL